MKTLISILTLIGISFSAFFFVDRRYALSDAVQELEQRVKLNELRDIERTVMEDVYFYRQQQRKYPADRQVSDKLEDAEAELNGVRKQIEEVGR